MNEEKSLNEKVQIPIEVITRCIYLIRGQKVMLDKDLAELYVVSTKNLNKAVERNIERFPLDFMFQLTSLKKSMNLWGSNLEPQTKAVEEDAIYHTSLPNSE